MRDLWSKRARYSRGLRFEPAREGAAGDLMAKPADSATRSIDRPVVSAAAGGLTRTRST
jgi:hypothetical protein